jgi:hypothetical protein
VSGGGGCAYVTGGDAYEVWNLPLSLPNGAQVQFLRLYYYDTQASTNMIVWFTKYDRDGNNVGEWDVLSNDGGFGYADVQITPAETINYESNSYVINWRPVIASANLQLCGVRIFYYFPYNTFIPSINR